MPCQTNDSLAAVASVAPVEPAQKGILVPCPELPSSFEMWLLPFRIPPDAPHRAAEIVPEVLRPHSLHGPEPLGVHGIVRNLMPVAGQWT